MKIELSMHEREEVAVRARGAEAHKWVEIEPGNDVRITFFDETVAEARAMACDILDATDPPGDLVERIRGVLDRQLPQGTDNAARHLAQVVVEMLRGGE